MISVQKVEDGAHHDDSTQIAVYNGVTHNPQNLSVVELLDIQ